MNVTAPALLAVVCATTSFQSVAPAPPPVVDAPTHRDEGVQLSVDDDRVLLSNRSGATIYVRGQDGHAVGDYEELGPDGWTRVDRGGACGTGVRVRPLHDGASVAAGELFLFDDAAPLPAGDVRYVVAYGHTPDVQADIATMPVDRRFGRGAQ